MAISKTTIQTRIQPFILRSVNKDVIDLLTDTEFLAMYNDVAKDLNEAAELRVENFYKQCNSTNAEDDDLTNYLTQRTILKVFSFKYEADAWADMIWTWSEDDNGQGVIVLKTAPETDALLDIWYLGDLEDVTDASDEIDLPDNLTVEYLELLKKKILADYTDQQVEYEKWLDHYANKAIMKTENRMMDRNRLRRSWLGLTGDDHKYEIDRQYVSPGDNITADVNGIFSFYT